MKPGFSYRGKHSREFGYLVTQTQKRAVMPSAKTVNFEISADGAVDLSAENEKKRVLYNERIFTVNLMICAENATQLNRRISAVCEWLTGEGELVFDDLPGVRWKSKITDSVETAPEAKGQKAVLTVNFVAEPFSYATFNTEEGIPIGSKIPIGAKIPIGLRRTHSVILLSSEQQITVYNAGTAPVSPKISIVHNSGAAELAAALGTRRIAVNYSAAAQTTVVFDMDNSIVTVGGRSVLPQSGAEFFELSPGYNTITVTAAAGDTVTVSYTPRFMYGWGV